MNTPKHSKVKGEEIDFTVSRVMVATIGRLADVKARGATACLHRHVVNVLRQIHQRG